MKNLINQNIFSDFVFKTKYKFDYENIKPVCDILLNEHSKYPKEDIHINSHSSFHSKLQPHTQIQFKKFYNFIRPIYLDLIINKWKFPKDLNYEVVASWINTYSNEGHIMDHTHTAMSTICVCSAYILHKKNAGNLLFKDPYFNFKKNIVELKNDNWLYQTVNIKENDVVFFPADMVHKSEPNKSNSERLVLSSNIAIKSNKLI